MFAAIAVREEKDAVGIEGQIGQKNLPTAYLLFLNMSIKKNVKSTGKQKVMLFTIGEYSTKVLRYHQTFTVLYFLW